jgi:hypothetical protein
MNESFRASFRPLVSCLRKPPAYVWVILGVSVAIPLYFTFSTHLIWEDFLITFRYSENLAHGNGVVYHPGERVQGFTSPLNMLLPALFAWVTGAKDFILPLWLFRIASLAGLTFALIAITSVLTREPPSSRPAFLLCCLFPVIAVLEIKITAFTMSGQEAGLVLGFLAPAFVLGCVGWPAHYRLGGVLFAGLMYSRPDACVYIAAIGVAAFAFETGSRRALAVALLKSGAICALLYLPWFLFTFVYYGSPIPHTVTAKYGTESLGNPDFGLLAPLVGAIQKTPEVLCWTLAPIYDWLDSGPAGWPKWVNDGAFGLELFAVLYWLIPSRDRVGRMASLFSFLLFGYMVYVRLVTQYSPWYFPPLAFMSLLVVVSAIASFTQRIRNSYPAWGFAVLSLAGVLFFLGFMFSSSLRPLQIKQQLIEWDHRRMIGLWLKEHVGKGEAVYLEPLGYIGYFSQCKMLDWPGLVSPEVVAARRKLAVQTGYTWIEVAEAIKPRWIVARYSEYEWMKNSDYLSKHYELVKVFDVIDKIRAFKAAPGMRIVVPESAFGILRRTD